MYVLRLYLYMHVYTYSSCMYILYYYMNTTSTKYNILHYSKTFSPHM